MKKQDKEDIKDVLDDFAEHAFDAIIELSKHTNVGIDYELLLTQALSDAHKKLHNILRRA